MKKPIFTILFTATLGLILGCSGDKEDSAKPPPPAVPAQPGGVMTPEQEKAMKEAERQVAAQNQGMASLKNGADSQATKDGSANK